ncbi:MAG TPA: hypothetical protein VII41_09870, partial [Steroidobacteraceae bacterium]
MLFSWDGDHLHVFRAGEKRYSDPKSRRPPSMRSSGPQASIPRRAEQARPGGSSCMLRPPGVLAVDYLHVDIVLLKRLHVLVFIEHGTRRMH